MKLEPGQKMSNKHIFRFRRNEGKIIKSPATVTNARKEVVLSLHEEHVAKALEAHGQGDPFYCAGAVCSRAHSHLFPHKFSDVEWIDTRAFFITKEDKQGLPVAAIVYEHRDSVAKLFDSQSGLKKLLADIRKNGPKILRLFPVRQSFSGANAGPYNKDGSKTKVSSTTPRAARKSPSKKGHTWRIHRTTTGLLPSERAAAKAKAA